MDRQLPTAWFLVVLSVGSLPADEPKLADTTERLSAAEEVAIRVAVTESGPRTASRNITKQPYPRVLVVPKAIKENYAKWPQATVRFLLKIVENGKPWDSIHAVCCIEALVDSPEVAAITAQGSDHEKWDDVIGGANKNTYREYSRQVCVKMIVEKEGAKAESATRPITEAESVVAVYSHCGGRSVDGPAVMFVAWPDGCVIWSEDKQKGGAPYRTGKTDPKKITALLANFDDDGLFGNKKLNRAYFGPDSSFVTVLVKSGKRQLKMESWHELYENDGKGVATDRGAGGLQGRRRLDVLSEEPSDYLFFRFVWSETRGKLAGLIPIESTKTNGKPVMDAGELSWLEAK